MKKSFFLILLGVLLPASFVSALGRYGSDIGLGNIVFSIQDALWMVFTVIVVICFVVAGIMFLTAQGDAKKLETAKSAVFWGIVGVAVGIIAYSIVYIMGGILTY
jgi:hypothetical protein